MIKYCLEKWDKNKSALEIALLNDKEIRRCGYKYLVELVVNHILNDTVNEEWNVSKITEIDDGDYQGTLLFVIPKDRYQPQEYDYLITYVGYGSCSGCDTLQDIQCYHKDEEVPIKGFMTLCRDIVSNIVKPFNTGWRNKEDFEPVQWDEKDDV